MWGQLMKIYDSSYNRKPLKWKKTSFQARKSVSHIRSAYTDNTAEDRYPCSGLEWWQWILDGFLEGYFGVSKLSSVLQDTISVP